MKTRQLTALAVLAGLLLVPLAATADNHEEPQPLTWLSFVQSQPGKSNQLTQHLAENGAKIYDVAGQNVCLADCLTIKPTTDDIRTLIFYGDGRLTYDWQYEGALLLGGNLPKAVPT